MELLANRKQRQIPALMNSASVASPRIASTFTPHAWLRWKNIGRIRCDEAVKPQKRYYLGIRIDLS